MQTITIDIINDKAIKLLEDLELLRLIRLRNDEGQPAGTAIARLKGAMAKQPLAEIDAQLDELRNAWIR